MKLQIVLSAFVAVAVAQPTLVHQLGVPLVTQYAAPFALSSQYHAQDELGQYSYGYSSPLSSKAEVKTFDGVTRGGYSYIDAEGKLQNVQYTADSVNGFRVAASNLPLPVAAPAPLPVQDTPEVTAAKAKHLEAVKEAETRAAIQPAEVSVPVAPYYYAYPAGYYPYVTTYASPYFHYNIAPLPTLPADTPEVAKAKAEHLAAVEEVKKARNL